MLVPFRQETLESEPFAKYDVQFNLMHRISEGELATALQAGDGGAIALQTPGRSLLLWIDPERGSDYAEAVVDELVDHLAGTGLPAVMAAPEYAAAFAGAWCQRYGVPSKPHLRMVSYHCRQVLFPAGVPGAMEQAGDGQVETVAELYFGFQHELFAAQENREEMLAMASAIVHNGTVFLWNVDGKTVSMAAIAHRTKRHGRVNAVFTAPEHRKHGYASALVATVSQIALDEGLTPMLYADRDYPASNSVYQAIGYVPAGDVDEIRFVYKA